jgi:hypothetical protein
MGGVYGFGEITLRILSLGGRKRTVVITSFTLYEDLTVGLCAVKTRRACVSAKCRTAISWPSRP